MKTLAIYAGSFNPIHVGHLNIVEKAEAIFGDGNVLVAIGINPSKSDGLDYINSIKTRANEIMSNIKRPVEIYTCFLHELIEEKEKDGYNVVLVRGLRNGDDLSYEDNQLKYIKDFKPDVKVVFIMCDEKYEHISSSAIRQLQSFRPGSANQYLI